MMRRIMRSKSEEERERAVNLAEFAFRETAKKNCRRLGPL